MTQPHFRKLLVANRSEIAIRVFRAATELGIPTVAIYSREDRFALHRFKADESYLVGAGKGPIEAYLDIADIIRIARDTGCDAIHPGYGFLSENPDFADACRDAGITFIGPSSDTMRLLGNKVAARNLAVEAGVPVMPATGALPEDPAEAAVLAEKIGYPLMLKASWGGGGRGMRIIETARDLPDLLTAARREAQAAFGNGEVYLEKLVRRARHVEVQILGDRHGAIVHLFERDCSVQRRNQKVVERAPAVYLGEDQRRELCDAALRLARAADYRNAGTVEFLLDADTGAFYFIEVNPRIQVEHTVTEVVTGIDIVKAQIRIAAGAAIGSPESGVPAQEDIRLNGHAIQCRLTTEDPDNNFIPDYGAITAYRGANGFGIRRQEVGLPVNFHTHDTSGAAAASVLAATEAGVDAVDAAMDAVSGMTSQPPLGAIVAALRHTPRDTGLDPAAIIRLSHYWEQVRHNYAAFESDIRSGSSEVYLHEMPGGQYTNLREQARSLGIEEHWDEVVRTYADVNRLFGDIVKVTPTSKVVGDMALMMVTSGLTAADVQDPAREIAFPDSVVSFFRGDLGRPTGGFPEALQAKVLNGRKPLDGRPGALMPPADLDAERTEAERRTGGRLDDRDLASYLMYPKVFTDFCQHRQNYGDVAALPTPIFFHGMEQGEEVSVEIERGKSLIIRYLATSDADEAGRRTVFFELNGQPRTVKITDRRVAPTRPAHPKAEDGNLSHIGAPMPGLVAAIAVRAGQKVERGDLLVSLEAMKMESAVRADRAGTVERVVAELGRNVETKDLLVVIV
jgi:pyruvate carboxylase